MNEMTTSAQSKGSVARPARAGAISPMGWLRTEIDRLFDDFAFPGRSAFNLPLSGVAPALDLVDEEKEYRLSAELPGLGEKDVQLTVADGVLTISGEKRDEQKREDKGFMLSERRYGSFRRQLALPSDVNPEGIKARFKDGVLIVTMPKDETAANRTRKIAIEQ